jgi:DNA-binding CsgD family transcriptional regulator
MAPNPLGRGLAAGVGAVAVLNTLSGVSMPVPDRAPDPPLVLAWLTLLSAHATLYWFGGRIRSRFGLRAYVVAQAAVVMLIAASGTPVPVTLGLFMACTAELIVLAGAGWQTLRITIGAITLFVLASLITADLYRATTAGLMLTLTAVTVHALAALLRRPAPASAPPLPTAHPAVTRNGAPALSARERAVLGELVRGARNGEIAATLGITERTVKSHLGSIYQKLGVESRSAAVAAALQRRLV